VIGAGLLAVGWWQALLHGLGAVLAYIYSLVPNYGVAIILFTLGIRLLLLPLGIKQIRSMQSMQAIQPQMKALQQKYKGNRQKLNEEVMKLYREHGVNPFMGCLPLLAQFPVLIALFAVLQFPVGLTHIPHSNSVQAIGTPQDSRLYVDLVCSGSRPSPMCREIRKGDKTHFLGANLLCNALQAGQPSLRVQARHVVDAPRVLDCGKGWPSRIPYYVFAAAMIASTYFQQKQMQRVTPASQQQPLLKFMPLLFGFWGFLFPAGLVIYWTTTNLVQIVQQRFMLASQPAPAPKARDDGGRSSTMGVGGIMRALGLRDDEPAPRKSVAKPREQAGGRGSGPQGQAKPNRINDDRGKRAGAGGRDGRSRKKRRKR
jgi:YidC/Oxa1 family membrane protein insertase